MPITHSSLPTSSDKGTQLVEVSLQVVKSFLQWPPVALVFWSFPFLMSEANTSIT